jgi:hypothetical protein
MIASAPVEGYKVDLSDSPEEAALWAPRHDEYLTGADVTVIEEYVRAWPIPRSEIVAGR